MHAEIIAIGDEITSGQLLDANSQWLSRRLEEIGIRVLYHTTVGDELDACADVFRHAIARADLVIATGGLGPTADDLTREAAAAATGRELVADPKAIEHIRAMFTRLKRKMPESNRRQALFPAGARMIHNPNGTAPGIDLEVPREGSGPSRVLVLPGVPAEMKEMWFDSIAETLLQPGGTRRLVRHRRIKCFGAGESRIEEMLPDLIRRGRRPRVGITAGKATIILRITADGPTEEACYAAMEPTIATIRKCLGNLIFGEGDDELQDAIVRLLREKDLTLSTAEWGTAGVIAEWLGSTAGAETHYVGGLVATSQAALTGVLGVKEELLARRPHHSSEVARAMAVNCRRQFATDYALAVGRFPETDPSAPEPSSCEPKPVFCALATPSGVIAKDYPHAGHPALLKTLCAKRALNLLRLTMLETPHV